MPELQPCPVPGKQPRRDDLIDDRWRASRNRPDQPQFDPGADQRRDIQQIAGLAAQTRCPRQHCVASRLRDVVHPRLYHLGDIERVSAGQPVQRGRLKPASVGQDPNRAGGKGWQPHPPRRPLCGKVTKSKAKRISRRQAVVTVGGNEQHRSVPDAPAKEPQQIDGRLIGPVNVLHNDHIERPRFADLPQQRTEQLLAGSVGSAQGEQLSAELTCEVEERPEWARGEQAIAGPPGPAGIRHLTRKPLHQRRLADACLSRDENQPPLASPSLPRVLGQRRQVRLPLQQLHAYSVRPQGRALPGSSAD